MALLVGLGFVVGNALHGWHWNAQGPRPGPGPGPADAGGRGPWWPLGIVGFVLVVGGIATRRAYHRLGGPVADLLGAAERLGRGDYDVRVAPAGPPELRSLATTINDVAVRLAAAEEQRRRFLADVTHELRTPLAVLQSGIEAQLDGIHPRDDGHLGSLLEETEVLARLVDDLHTLALADAGRLTLHPERTHPAALVADAVEGHATLAARKGVRLESTVADDLPELDVDPTRIGQVLANLLANAVRHTPDGGRVDVAVNSEDTSVRFTVTDSGPGFPADQLATVFDRFTRAADSRGSGLGLSIARDLVVAHGGTIEASNRPVGGAVVHFTLPTPA
jgi:signal transduction histidine kinase